MAGRRAYGKLNIYLGREYIASFFVSFAFFFFIFFVNQILVLAQKILLKNVSLSDMLTLVILSIPQFLMYTMPFSSLAAASMVIGNFSSQNEILAMKSCGIRNGRIFRPIIVISLVLSVATFFIADRMIPFTADRYRALYAQVLEKIPTVELESYSSTRFGNRVISNGRIEDNTIYDVLIYDNSDSSDSRVVKADSGRIGIVDIESLTYRIDLENPSILITDAKQAQSWSVANAKSMTMYLTLGNGNSTGLAALTPSQMSISQLKEASEAKAEEHYSHIEEKGKNILSSYGKLGAALEGYAYDSEYKTSFSRLETLANTAQGVEESPAYSFYYQYYRSELTKKIALAAACTCLVFIAFPISFFRVKNGRLIGFGLSMLLACFYWFFLYFMHTKAVTSSINPTWLIWLPNTVFLIAGIALIWRMRRR